MNLSEILNRDSILHPLHSNDCDSVVQELLAHLRRLDFLSGITKLCSNIVEVEKKNV